MHELSIALNLIARAREEAQQLTGRVVALHVQVGPFSGVVGDALSAAFELARAGTFLNDSRLIIEETPLLMKCTTCEDERAVVSMQDLRCGTCGEPAAEIVSGRELLLTALEVEAQ